VVHNAQHIPSGWVGGPGELVPVALEHIFKDYIGGGIIEVEVDVDTDPAGDMSLEEVFEDQAPDLELAAEAVPEGLAAEAVPEGLAAEAVPEGLAAEAVPEGLDVADEEVQ
jgi:hypothetical protein